MMQASFDTLLVRLAGLENALVELHQQLSGAHKLPPELLAHTQRQTQLVRQEIEHLRQAVVVAGASHEAAPKTSGVLEIG